MNKYRKTVDVMAAKILESHATHVVVEGEEGPERMSLGRNWIDHNLPQAGQYLVITEPGRYCVFKDMEKEGFRGVDKPKKRVITSQERSADP